jgi:hypothetical protein
VLALPAEDEALDALAVAIPACVVAVAALVSAAYISTLLS